MRNAARPWNERCSTTAAAIPSTHATPTTMIVYPQVMKNDCSSACPMAALKSNDSW